GPTPSTATGGRTWRRSGGSSSRAPWRPRDPPEGRWGAGTAGAVAVPSPRVLRTVARSLRQLFPPAVLKGQGAQARFDVDTARRLAMARGTIESQQAAQLDPTQTAEQAQRSRSQGLRLQAWSIVLVLVLALLTFARLSEPVPPRLAGRGMAVVG